MALPYTRVNFVDGTTPLNAATLNKVDQGVDDLDKARAQANGIATLGADGKVPAAQLPAGTADIPKSIIDAKGDLIVGTADDTPARLGIGTDGQVPTADSSQATGVRWGPRASGIPVNLSVVSGGAYWTVAALANFNQPLFMLPDAVTAWIQGIVYIPSGITSVRLRVIFAPIVAGGGNVAITGQAESVSDGVTLNGFTGSDMNQNATVALPATAWLTKHWISNPVTGFVPGDLLQIRVIRLGADAADTHASALGVVGAWLEPS